MGCEFCACNGGTGPSCLGPLHGIDDLEAYCDCDCHKCPDCGSAFCETMGGHEPCVFDEDMLDEEPDSWDGGDAQ